MMDAVSVSSQWKDCRTRDGQAGFGSVKCSKKKNPTNKKTKQNCCLQGEARGQTEVGDAGTWGGEHTGHVHVCGKEKKETGKGESFRKNEIEKESG